ncbi:hypothetical protein BVX97_03605 [bacterium E08(2017)]|nr:hypothetical protein BVX97_03605 [bacterium E08(2017)]
MHAVVIVFMVLLSVIIVGICIAVTCNKLEERRKEAYELHLKVQRAKAEILADGVVSGPKGEYVPHKPWNAGLGRRTPTDLKPPKSGVGYHGMPLP